MKSTRPNESKRVIVGAVLGLCILGGTFGWHKWQTWRGEWPTPVYTRTHTAGAFAYQEIPWGEYKKSWNEMALSSPSRYTKVNIPGVDDYSKITTSEAQGYSVKAARFKVQHSFPAAIAELRKVVLADPSSPQMKFELGLTLQRGSQTEEAKKMLRQAAQEPDFTGKIAARMLAKIEKNPNYAQPKR